MESDFLEYEFLQDVRTLYEPLAASDYLASVVRSYIEQQSTRSRDSLEGGCNNFGSDCNRHPGWPFPLGKEFAPPHCHYILAGFLESAAQETEGFVKSLCPDPLEPWKSLSTEEQLRASADWIGLRAYFGDFIEGAEKATADHLPRLRKVLDAAHWDLESRKLLPKSVGGKQTKTVNETLSQDSTKGFLGGKALIDALRIHPSRRDAFLQQVGRKRISLGDACWHEVRDTRPNSPKYLYLADSPKLVELAEEYRQPKSV